ncbi:MULTISPECIES: beta-glucosidase family protein [unclassified Streptomyces]|uniref:beta-glucosidase family protein n=1 Tax=unclassified Streptomyces TaxID=2593676 RepID=UPI002DD98D4D|nr:glycoside hydrolase family 3 N-terminal domain-containing protein [Streptomyces sp. NBC_01445]WSE11404.1 glycoside hydrolase family 3 C-terminal domain-containing protein [Streptomyces sp. NBC_01445]
MNPWNDTSLCADERVKSLLAEMTRAEKIAQLGGYWAKTNVGSGDARVAPIEEALAARSNEPTALAHGIGHLTRPYGTRPLTPEEGRAELVRVQRMLTGSTRLGIPAIAHDECLTGFAAFGATVYPTPLAWAATFDSALVEKMGAAIGHDMASVGVHQGLAPVLDVVRDYRWGRVEETLGEDPYLTSLIGTAYVRGMQSQGVVATLKHFAGHAASRGARNHAPVSIGAREMADVILPPFEMAVREGAVGSVMNSYTDQDGVPACADESLLTKVLREQWGFTGTVVSDYGSIAFLQTMHRVAATEGDAARLALTAGMDVELPNTRCYGDPLAQQLDDGLIAPELLDRAVERVLRQKLRLGLLDADYTPEADAGFGTPVDLDSPTNRTLARTIAERSIVLLANEGAALPLDAACTPTIALIGPGADDATTFLGCYSFPNHVLPKYPGHPLGLTLPTLREALTAQLPDITFVHEPGCKVSGGDRSGLPAAARAAASADLALVVVGDRAGMFGNGTSGEGCDAPHLQLPGVQAQLIEKVLATGTPVVLLVVSGRPYALGGLAERCVAVVQTFMPGEEGGPALARVLSGRACPSGKLPVQIPATPDSNPGTYLTPLLGRHSEGISVLDNTPLYPFGHGLSYTSFSYEDLRLDGGERVPTDGFVEVSCLVRNTGQRAGRETVQLYYDDPVAQVARPTLQLAAFDVIDLAPGAQSRVTFKMHADQTSYTKDASGDGRRLVEPGTIRLMLGSSSGDIRLSADVELTGPQRWVGAERHLRHA